MLPTKIMRERWSVQITRNVRANERCFRTENQKQTSVVLRLCCIRLAITPHRGKTGLDFVFKRIVKKKKKIEKNYLLPILYVRIILNLSTDKYANVHKINIWKIIVHIIYALNCIIDCKICKIKHASLLLFEWLFCIHYFELVVDRFSKVFIELLEWC